MRFWDTSAIIPLLVRQSSSNHAQALHALDPKMAVWWGTSVECASAIARLERESALSSEKAKLARRFLHSLSISWLEVLPGNEIRESAIRLLRIHGLKAADALQLAAAIAIAASSRGAIPIVLLFALGGRFGFRFTDKDAG